MRGRAVLSLLSRHSPLTSELLVSSAPEVVARHRYGRPVDCWAVGVIMFILWVPVSNYKTFYDTIQSTVYDPYNCQLRFIRAVDPVHMIVISFQPIREPPFLRWNRGGEHRSAQSHHLLSHRRRRLWVRLSLLGWHFTRRYLSSPQGGSKYHVETPLKPCLECNMGDIHGIPGVPKLKINE